jgi:hypothetical protein
MNSGNNVTLVVHSDMGRGYGNLGNRGNNNGRGNLNNCGQQ